MSHPRGGAHYPRSVGEFQAWFQADADCLDYLEWLRWPDGFVCPDCGHAGGWRLGDGRFECSACGARTSVTAGTIFDRTRTPLTVWFTACWMFASGKDGMSALSLQRGLEIGSYQTAGALLPAVHRVASLVKRWLLGTHQGSVEAAHLPSYLNEFVFRFNRRRSRSRGLVFYRVLELSVGHRPVRYQDLIATKRPAKAPLAAPHTRGNPPSLDRPSANRPWRTADLQSSG